MVDIMTFVVISWFLAMMSRIKIIIIVICLFLAFFFPVSFFNFRFYWINGSFRVYKMFHWLYLECATVDGFHDVSSIRDYVCSVYFCVVCRNEQPLMIIGLSAFQSEPKITYIVGGKVHQRPSEVLQRPFGAPRPPFLFLVYSIALSLSILENFRCAASNERV